MEVLKPAKKVETKVNQKTICIIQITRIGDLVQTYISAQCLKNEHPDIRLKLIGRTQFVKPLQNILSTVFDEIHSFDTLDFLNPENLKLKESINLIRDFTNQINKTPNDVCINLSFSKSSTYLTSLVNTKNRLGPHRNALADMVIKDRWSQYIYSTVMRGPYNPFSLIDIFNNILGVTNFEKPIAQQRKTKNIVCHPFASHDKKTWQFSKWAEVIYKTLKDHPDFHISIVGSKSEIDMSKQIEDSPLLEKYKNRFSNLTGKTNIDDLVDILESTQLFIGHDSMVSHLASITKTQSITIALGTVREHETSPYLENSYVLAPKTDCFPCFPTDKCDFKQCHADIPYQIVHSAISQVIKSGKINLDELKSESSIFHLSSVNLYRTEFNQHGYLQLDNILNKQTSTTEIMRDLYRIGWLFFLGSKEEKASYPILTQETQSRLLTVLSHLKHIYELSEFGKKYSQYILEDIASKTPNISNIKKYSSKLDDIENLLEMVKKTGTELDSFIDFFMIVRGNLKGDNIVELTESSYLSYYDSALFASVLFELIEKTISEYKLTSGQRAGIQQVNM